MNTPIFDKKAWIERLTSEIGLAGVPYEELDQHKVDFSFSFIANPNPEFVKTARQYIDEQLAEIEASYEQFKHHEMGESLTNPLTITDIGSTLNSVLGQIGDIPDEQPLMPSSEELAALQIPYIEMAMKQEEILCFDVVINNLPYVVAINYDGTDIKIKDQIKHVISTTFFIEVRDKTTIRDGEQVISYYQFVNAIQPYIKQPEDLTSRILKDVSTTFDGGAKLDGF